MNQITTSKADLTETVNFVNGGRIGYRHVHLRSFINARFKRHSCTSDHEWRCLLKQQELPGNGWHGGVRLRSPALAVPGSV
jgi:hypothetical protein